MKLLSKTIMAILALTCLSAIADEVKVTIKSPRKTYYPVSIQLIDRQGSISFTNSRDGRKYTFRRNQILSIETEMPRDVLALENIFRSMDYDKVVKLTEKVSLQSMWTGWGSYVMFMKGMAEMNQKKYADATKTIQTGKALYGAVDGRDKFMDFGVTAVTYAKQGGNIIETPSSAGMLLNGLALENKKDLRAAALEYMKAMELYPAANREGVPNLERVVALMRLVEVLKASRDTPTANKIAGVLAAGK